MAQASGEASVFLQHVEVGVLSRVGNVSSFEFHQGYLDMPARPVLGQRFEEDPRARLNQAHRLPYWFSNLLPEPGPLRRFLARELDLKEEDEFGILVALGGDLPGAVSVGPSNDELSAEALHHRFDRNVDYSTPVPLGGIRHSVAGVHVKLSMVRDGNTIRLAGRGEYGNHYIKFPGSIELLPENEFTNMRLAALCGLNVPAVDLVPADSLGELPPSFDRVKNRMVYLVERFDRDGGSMIHIEDFNQIVGNNWPEEKYEGISFENFGRLVHRLCGEVDFTEFLRRVVFNFAVGNEDAHLKNWSVVYADGSTPSLSPLYDVVSTVVLPELTREVPLKLRGSRRMRGLDENRLLHIPRAVGMSDVESSSLVSEFLDQVIPCEEEFRREGLLPSSHWDRLDSYRASVPLLRQLV